MYTIDIDVGGTLTDGLFSDGERVWVAKVDTTPHDFTVCFFDCLHEGAVLTGHPDLTEFLEHVEVVRWSSTIATNVLAEGKGPRIGLLVSPGHAEDLYGQSGSPAIGRLISSANIVTVQDPTNQEEVLGAIRSLLEQGVRRICISLQGAFQDDSSELGIKRLVEEQFPDHYLGAVPALLGSQISRHPDDMTRTHLALINAYVHTPLAMALFKAEDELLSRHNYRQPIYIGHVNGGVARVSKTKGVDTTESGPVFGLVAAAYFARRYQLDRVIALDVGGTTAKVSLIVAGEPVMAPETDFFGIPLDLPWTLLRSTALGGGSVARVSEGGVTLGPDSMGAYPGPACYDLGGEAATLTDALLVAGMLNPGRFLGGRRELDLERAWEALDKHIATSLASNGVETAARLVIDTAVTMIADTINRVLTEAGYSSEGFHLFCFGGNGANFAAATAAQLGLEDAYVFKFGPVLSAFGSSRSDISHVYEEWPFLDLSNGALRQTSPQDAVWGLVEAGRQRVLRDLEGEGLPAAKAVLSVELSVADRGKRQDWIVELQPEKLRDVLSGAHSASGGVVERVAVRGVLPVRRLELEAAPEQRYTPGPYGQRQVFGEQVGLYDWENLTPGATITGPAVLESATNTCTVPAGWGLQLDGFGNAVLRQAKGGQ
jgi:acetophenone carboxylase